MDLRTPHEFILLQTAAGMAGIYSLRELSQRSQFAMSYSGNKKVMKHFQKISRDLYSYYGVSEADIRDKTQRYSELVTALCT